MCACAFVCVQNLKDQRTNFFFSNCCRAWAETIATIKMAKISYGRKKLGDLRDLLWPQILLCMDNEFSQLLSHITVTPIIITVPVCPMTPGIVWGLN